MKKLNFAVLLVLLVSLMAGTVVQAQADPDPTSIEIVGYVTAITESAIIVDGLAIPFGPAFDSAGLLVGDRVQIVGHYVSGELGEVFVADSLLIVPADDLDLDGVLDGVDNCVDIFNPGQLDEDGDGVGNACEARMEGPENSDDDTATPTISCLQQNHPVAHTLAEAFGVDYNTIAAWACEYGIGEVARALLMADQVEGAVVEDLLARATETGWGVILQESGLSPSAFAPGQVISGRYKGQAAIVEGEMLQLQLQERVRVRTEFNAPGNSGNAPGHNRDEGSAPGNSGNAPGHNRDEGSAPGNSGNAPGQNKKN